MKEIYSFELTKVISDEPEKEESIVYKFVFKRPDREEREDINIFNAAYTSKLLEKGIMSIHMLNNIYKDSQKGIMSDSDERNFVKLQQDYHNNEMELAQINLNTTLGQKEREEKIRKLIGEQNVIRDELTQLHADKVMIYDKTAEIMSRDKTIEYIMILLSYYKVGQEEDVKPLFEGETMNDRYVKYEEIDDSDDDFLKKAIMQLMLVSTFWFLGYANDVEDFENLIRQQKEIEEETETENT